MRSLQRRTGTSVIERLLAAPQGFEFVQAVTILLRWLAERGIAPERALRDHLRFENSLHLGFPPSQIEALRLARAATEAASGTAADTVPDGALAGAPQGLPQEDGEQDLAGLQFRMTPAFMGLLGAQGALPAHYTERLQQWQHANRDEAPRAFLDMFSGRMLALYYAAWRKYRVEYGVECGAECGGEYGAAGRGDPFRAQLLALAGIAGTEARQVGSGCGGPEAVIAYFAGMLQQRPRSAAVLERLLAGYFDLPVVLEQAVGHWSRMDPHEQCALGVQACLGENTMLGERSWRPDLRARLRIGPLSRDVFERFLPSGDMAAALRRILAWFAVPGVDFEVQLILRADEVGPSRLAAASAPGARLGRDSFLVTAAAAADRADMRYLISTMAPLRPARRRTPGP